MPSERDKARWTDPGPSWQDLQRWKIRFKSREFPTAGCLLVLSPPIVLAATYYLGGMIIKANQGAMFVGGAIIYIVAAYCFASMLVGVGLLLSSRRQASERGNASDKIPWWLWCFGISGMFITVFIIVYVGHLVYRAP